MRITAAHRLLVLVWLLVPAVAQAQSKYLTKSGRITFSASSPIEDIEAKNEAVAAVIDLAAGQVAFSVPIKGFVFKRTLMQEHFNENYLESDKFPKATFTGKFTGFDASSLATPGAHPAQVEGDLTIHGVTHHIVMPAALELKDGQLLATASFMVLPADYKIDIPMLVRDHIAKIVSVQVSLNSGPIATPAPAATSPNSRTTNN